MVFYYTEQKELEDMTLGELHQEFVETVESENVDFERATEILVEMRYIHEEFGHANFDMYVSYNELHKVVKWFHELRLKKQGIPRQLLILN